MIEIASVNVGRRERLEGRSFRGETGILKQPVDGAVSIGALGLDGDAVVNTRHHGGPDQAVYGYRSEDYEWWSESLGAHIPPGAFGDNLTLQGLPEANVPVGTRISFDTLVLEVTAPRIPCNTLAQRMGDPAFIKRFIAAERPGLYFRVVQPGEARVGDTGQLTDYDGEPVTTLEIFRAAYRKLTADELRRFLDAPIDVRTRTDYEKQLSRLEGP